MKAGVWVLTKTREVGGLGRNGRELDGRKLLWLSTHRHSNIEVSVRRGEVAQKSVTAVVQKTFFFGWMGIFVRKRKESQWELVLKLFILQSATLI